MQKWIRRFFGWIKGGDMAGSVAIDKKYVYDQQSNLQKKVLIFTCTGDATDGSIPNQSITGSWLSFIKGWNFEEVIAFPTVGGTAPDAADVFVLDENGEDMLGSPDGGTTPGYGANLIHATLTKSCVPYMVAIGATKTRPILGALTLKVSGQATVSANYTIKLVFSC